MFKFVGKRFLLYTSIIITVVTFAYLSVFWKRPLPQKTVIKDKFVYQGVFLAKPYPMIVIERKGTMADASISPLVRYYVHSTEIIFYLNYGTGI